MEKNFGTYKTEIRVSGLTISGVWHIEAESGCVLVRKSDGKVITSATLGIEYRDRNGALLEHPYIEKPEDYEEISIEDYKRTHPEWDDTIVEMSDERQRENDIPDS